MFDFSFSEMMLAGAVALVVLGPERLPKAARTAGEWAGRLRRAAGSLKSELAQHGEYAELAKLKTELTQTADEIKQDLREVGARLETETLPPWERLPEQRTPEDFVSGSLPYAGGLHGKSLHKQAMARRRDLRPRRRVPPRLRGRR